MKKLILFIFIILVFVKTLFAIDTITCKYVPLAVGNVYKFHYGTSSGGGYYFKIRISKDSIIGNKKYFVMSQGYFGTTYPTLVRFDTLSGNFYERSSNGYCQYSPYEIIYDSLKSSLHDSIVVCNSTNKHICTDTNYWNVFGNIVKAKRFIRFESPSCVYVEYVYAMGFGIIGVNCYGQNLSGYGLIGCYINGVLYGDTTLSVINQISSTVPEKFSLHQNFPNPFNPITKIRFALKENGKGKKEETKLIIYDILGKEIQTLVNEQLSPGTYEVTLDGSNLPSGIYFYQLRSGEYLETKKLVLLK
jgi:hypothetical protein